MDGGLAARSGYEESIRAALHLRGGARAIRQRKGKMHSQAPLPRPVLRKRRADRRSVRHAHRHIQRRGASTHRPAGERRGGASRARDTRGAPASSSRHRTPRPPTTHRARLPFCFLEKPRKPGGRKEEAKRAGRPSPSPPPFAPLTLPRVCRRARKRTSRGTREKRARATRTAPSANRASSACRG